MYNYFRLRSQYLLYCKGQHSSINIYLWIMLLNNKDLILAWKQLLFQVVSNFGVVNDNILAN